MSKVEDIALEALGLLGGRIRGLGRIGGMFDPRRPSTGGHFELQVDGHPSTAYLRSVDGGYCRTALIDEPIGPDNYRIKHTSVTEIEPLSVDFGISGGEQMLQWIQASWRKDYSRRNGQITHADFDLNQLYEHEFYDALITETTFPTLDGSSKEGVFLRVKMHPEQVVSRKCGGGKLRSNIGRKQKMWMSSGFRLNIDGIEGIDNVSRIDSFTICQGVQRFYTGEDRFPQIEPTKLDFPPLTGHLSLAYADDLIAWYDESVVNGMADPAAQRTGSLDFLDTDRSTVLFRINLFEVGLNYLGMVPCQANANEIKRMKFELYVGRMDIDDRSFGMEDGFGGFGGFGFGGGGGIREVVETAVETVLSNLTGGRL